MTTRAETAPPSTQASSPLSFDYGGLTTAQFQNALDRHIDVSKPDPLAKGQMENLRLSWQQSPDVVDDVSMPSAKSGHNATAKKGGNQLNICGTLTLSSEFLSVAIYVACDCKTNCDEDALRNDCSAPIKRKGCTKEKSTDESISNHSFQNEFYLRLTVDAKTVPIDDKANSSTNEGKRNRKERALRRKLRAGMMRRLYADPLVRKLLTEEDNNSKSSPTEPQGTSTTTHPRPTKEGNLPLIEALIQQNQISKERNIDGVATAGEELEERVNVHEESLGGIRNALFSHCEDNLDVLEILLNMPYLPRSSSGRGVGGGGGSGVETSLQRASALSTLAERAYLRLLEDAMFDACEKEGEDELLDDLNISDSIHDHGNGIAEVDEGSAKGRGGRVQSKRIKSSDGRW